MDKEDEDERRGSYHSLGCNPDSDWYGGKVDIPARLKITQDGNYKIVLEQPRLGASTRFKRQYRSKSFLFVKIPLDIRRKPKNQLMEYFKRPFILMGRVYRAFMLNEDTVHLFLAADNFTVSDPVSLFDVNRFWDFMMWHNSIRMNCNQVS